MFSDDIHDTARFSAICFFAFTLIIFAANRLVLNSWAAAVDASGLGNAANVASSLPLTIINWLTIAFLVLAIISTIVALCTCGKEKKRSHRR